MVSRPCVKIVGRPTSVPWLPLAQAPRARRCRSTSSPCSRSSTWTWRCGDRPAIPSLSPVYFVPGYPPTTCYPYRVIETGPCFRTRINACCCPLSQATTTPTTAPAPCSTACAAQARAHHPRTCVVLDRIGPVFFLPWKIAALYSAVVAAIE